MNTYKRRRFSLGIISYAAWRYYRFYLNHRDIEDLLAERGINVSIMTISRQIHSHNRTLYGSSSIGNL